MSCFNTELTFTGTLWLGIFWSQCSNQLHILSCSSLKCQGYSWELIFAGSTGLSSMRNLARQSMENDEVTLRAHSGKTVVDKPLSRKSSKSPLWLWFPGEGMILSQFSLCATGSYWYMISWAVPVHALHLQCWEYIRMWVCEESEFCGSAWGVPSCWCPQHQTPQSSFLLTDAPKKVTFWHPHLRLSGWWVIHFYYWSHTAYYIVLWTSVTFSVKERK